VIYQIVFFVLFLARPVSLTLLAIADHDSFDMSIPGRVVICAILGVPAVYTFYSVVRYFGMARAAGIDHFDESYRSKPLVKEGIFRYTSNSMYSFAFLTFWAIAVTGASWAALVVAMFSHAYIWVHYFCTERPDMKAIYGSTPQ
jgi:protein-S-isoprenylcysteine O-methyltransferase Ste14